VQAIKEIKTAAGLARTRNFPVAENWSFLSSFLFI